MSLSISKGNKKDSRAKLTEHPEIDDFKKPIHRHRKSLHHGVRDF